MKPTSDVALLFGGNGGSAPGVLDDTWEFRWTSDWPDEGCDNGVDDDGDALVDCADPDCDNRACAGGVCQGGVCL